MSSASAKPLKIKRSLLPLQGGLLVLLVGLLFTVIATWQLHRHNEATLTRRLEQLTDTAEQLVRKRFEIYEYGLRGARGALLAAGLERLDRKKFKQYMGLRDLTQEFSGARGFGFIRKLAANEVADFIDYARADAAPNFSLRSLGANEGDRFIIQYIYPEEGNEGATGLDIASEANRRSAALEAARDGEVHLTAPITLVQAGGKTRHGFLILLPIYRPDLLLNSPDAREEATFGWSYAPLVVDEVLADLGPVMRELRLTLTDKAETQPFYVSGPESGREHETFAIEREITIQGRHWLLQAECMPVMAELLGLWSPWYLASSGFVLTVVLAGGLAFWLRRQQSAQAESLFAAKDDIDFSAFLHSPAVRHSALAYVATLVIFFIDQRVLPVAAAIGRRRTKFARISSAQCKAFK